MKKSIVMTMVAVLILVQVFLYGEGKVNQIKVVADKAPDCSSRKAIVESITRGCKTNDAKAIAINNFCKIAWYHRAYPSEKGGVAALKMLNVYGWSLCGGQHSVLSSLWAAAGFDYRFIGWPGHTTVEVKYDGSWHYFDTFLKFYTWKVDPNLPNGRTVASQADIAANPDLVNKLVLDKERRVYYFPDNKFEMINGKANWTAPSMLVCGDGPQGVIAGCQKRKNPRRPGGWAGISHDERGYNTDINLGPGMSLELMWKAIPDCWYWARQKEAPYHTCNDKEFRNCPIGGPVMEPYIGVYPRGTRTYANGVLVFTPDLSDDAFLAGLEAKDNVKVAGGRLVPADSGKPGSITIRMQLPYVFVKATGKAEGVDSAEISVDSGKTFKPVELKDFSSSVKGKYDCQLKLTVKTALKSLRLETVVQQNRGSLPYLSPGKNKITVSVADPKQLGNNKLCVTYAYNVGQRRVPYEELCEGGYEVGKGHKASWSDTPTVVQKVFSSKDLPAEFEIDIPTPKDKYPVYPRMLFMKKEVLSPNQKPAALPKGAAEPKMGPNDELKTLPNPFLIGTILPPKKIKRPVEKKKVVLELSHVVTSKGKTYPNYWIKTKPKSPDWWIMLVKGSLDNLPNAKDIDTVYICLPVTNTHPKANVKVGIVALKEPFEKDKPYDGKNFGAILGTAVFPKQAKPGEAKYYKIDITRYVKNVSRGKEKFNGFAIKVIPDRPTDDGWTVRIDVTKEKETYLEMDVYKTE